MHTAKTITPINISIYCGKLPRNMPPKIKLAKVNFAMSINDFPTLSFKSGFSTFFSMLSRCACYASVSDDVNGAGALLGINPSRHSSSTPLNAVRFLCATQ